MSLNHGQKRSVIFAEEALMIKQTMSQKDVLMLIHATGYKQMMRLKVQTSETVKGKLQQLKGL